MTYTALAEARRSVEGKFASLEEGLKRLDQRRKDEAAKAAEKADKENQPKK